MNSVVTADQQHPEQPDWPTSKELSPDEWLLVRHYRGLTCNEKKFMLHALSCMARQTMVD